MNLNTPQGMEAAKQWQLSMLAKMRHGGTWYVPRACSTYTVDHANKTLTRSGLKSDPSINKVCEAIGWKVIEK